MIDILGCPSLTSITTEGHSFNNTSVLQLNTLPHLHTFCIGDFSFKRLQKVVLQGLNDIEIQSKKVRKCSNLTWIIGEEITENALNAFKSWLKEN